jgi:hypothetical protein
VKCLYQKAGRARRDLLHEEVKRAADSNRVKRKKEMKLFKAVTAMGGIALMGALIAPAAKADDWNQKTTITFSAPVEIPGVHLAGWAVLPAGTYVFKLMDSQSDRHIVQIFNKDETTIYATILAVPNYRLHATDKTVMTFRERAAGEPEALRAWFYPGKRSGEEFVYPKAKAMELAKAENTVVPFTTAEIPGEVTEPIKPADETLVATLQQAPVMAVKPTGEEIQLTEVVTPAPQTLPATASPLPTLAFFGLLALGGAMSLRAFEKRAG